MSLSLFEAAKTLKDEYLENCGFDLLQESLLSKIEDISFENRLSGIGYVLRYLIKNEFIEADFDEMFREQTEKILAGLEKRSNDSKSLQNLTKIIYFLSDINRTNKDKRFVDYIHLIFKAIELRLTTEFADFKQSNNKSNKSMILIFFEEYLRLVAYSKIWRNCQLFFIL
jgi:hypothetical protein